MNTDDEELEVENFDFDNQMDSDQEAEQEEGWFDGDTTADNGDVGESEMENSDIYNPNDEYDSEELTDMAEEQEEFEEENPDTDGELDTTEEPTSEELTDMAEDEETEEQNDAEMREWAMEQHLENDAINEAKEETSGDY